MSQYYETYVVASVLQGHTSTLTGLPFFYLGALRIVALGVISFLTAFLPFEFWFDKL
jgi:hypothetical protein